MFDSTIPYDLRFFQSLDRFVQREPWLDRDRAMIDHAQVDRHREGQAVQSRREDAGDPERRRARSARLARLTATRTVFSPPFNEGTHWALPASPEVVEGMMTNFAEPDAYPVDGRGVAYSMAFFSAKHLGAGQYYLMTITDKDGKPFDGGSTYRLTVPANAPVRLYWSATVYDRATHALIRDLPWSSRSSQHAGPADRTPTDRSDVYFGPKAPAGKESNWVPTSAGRKVRSAVPLSTAPRSRCSTRRGGCRTSSGSQRKRSEGPMKAKSRDFLHGHRSGCSAITQPVGAARRPQPSCRSPSTTSSAPRSDLYFAGIVKDRARSASSSIAASRRRSTTRPSSGSTATRSIRRPCSTSMPGR